MLTRRLFFALPVILGATLLAPSSQGALVRDTAGMFSKDAVKKAQARLEKLERSTHIPVVIETIDSIPGIDPDAPSAERGKAVDALAVRRDEAIGDEGIYILIAKRDHAISHVLVRKRLAHVLSIDKRDAIRNALREEFRAEKYDRGLLAAVEAMERGLEGVSTARTEVHGVNAPLAVRDHDGAAPRAARHSGFGSFFLIILGIFGVLIILRVIGGLFGRRTGAGYGAPMGGMPRPGYGGGPGYAGGPGYGGGGGGFFSGLLGGLGGALAGNWIYDQFSGRHHQGMNPADAGYMPGESSVAPGDGGDAIVGADDDIGGGGATWDDAPGGDAGGGDWGGGGGDWGGGGGGGDWGGGGGDWGGGGGGGDW
jgi:uncharacterized membrane protein YgcG